MLDKYCAPIENNVYDLSKAFAIRVVKLFNYLVDNKKEYVMSKQLLRSGTSIGANVLRAKMPKVGLISPIR